nr:enoyl-CoA hydratase-related protein [Herbaspirillum sp. LeCh32-8]
MNARVPPSCVELETKKHGLSKVGWVWINRPYDGNTIDRLTAQEIIRAVGAFAKDAQVRAIVLAARGDSFSRGIEVQWLRSQAEAPINGALEDARKLAQLLQVLAECEKPTIARVQGDAAGIGAGLAAACDICIAADHACFTMGDDRLGMAPSVITPHLVRAIGARQCQRYFQTNEPLTAARACALGLAHETVPAELLDDKLTALLASLLLGDVHAQHSANKLIRAIAAAPPALDMTADAVRIGARMRAFPSVRERLGLQAERRSPAMHRITLDSQRCEAD